MNVNYESIATVAALDGPRVTGCYLLDDNDVNGCYNANSGSRNIM